MEENKDYNEDLQTMKYKISLESSLNSGAGWFYWIAGLSIINTITYFIGTDWSFINGLGITQFIDAIAYEIGGNFIYVGFIINILIASMFILFGKISKKRKNWSFIVGMIIYALDSILFILIKDWVSVGFHVLALYGIYGGLKANKVLSTME